MPHRTTLPAPYLNGASVGVEAGCLHTALEILDVVPNVDELRLHESHLILQALHTVQCLKRRLIDLQTGEKGQK